MPLYTANAAQVMNRTRDFFTSGVKPLWGLDEVDRLLYRKVRSS